MSINTASRFASDKKDSYRFIVGSSIIPVVSFRLEQTINTLFDSWVAEIAWIPGEDPGIDADTSPFSYSDSFIYLGGQLAGTGRLYDVEQTLTDRGSSKVLYCHSKTVDLVDSKMPPDSSYESHNGTLQDVASSILGKLGYEWSIDGVSLADVWPGAPFDWIAIDKIESYGAYLLRLARQRGVLVMNDEFGNVRFLRANPTQTPVGTIDDASIQGAAKSQASIGTVGAFEWKTKFEGRKLFNQYWVLGQGGDATQITSSGTDDNVPAGRVMTFEGQDVDTASVQLSAAWRRSKAWADALSFPVPVASWYAPNGKLWRPGQIVTIKSAYVGTPNGYNFLIEGTEHVLDERGMTCTLKVVPPQTFTGEPITGVFQ